MVREGFLEEVTDEPGPEGRRGWGERASRKILMNAMRRELPAAPRGTSVVEGEERACPRRPEVGRMVGAAYSAPRGGRLGPGAAQSDREMEMGNK